MYILMHVVKNGYFNITNRHSNFIYVSIDKLRPINIYSKPAINRNKIWSQIIYKINKKRNNHFVHV